MSDGSIKKSAPLSLVDPQLCAPRFPEVYLYRSIVVQYANGFHIAGAAQLHGYLLSTGLFSSPHLPSNRNRDTRDIMFRRLYVRTLEHFQDIGSRGPTGLYSKNAPIHSNTTPYMENHPSWKKQIICHLLPSPGTLRIPFSGLTIRERSFLHCIKIWRHSGKTLPFGSNIYSAKGFRKKTGMTWRREAKRRRYGDERY